MKKKKKGRFLPIVLLVVCAMFVVALGSYAYWQMTRKQHNKNVVGSTCLSIYFDNESGDIDLAGAWPMTEEEGVATEPYSFTITNNCDTEVNYQIALESLKAEGNESTNYLSYDYLRVKLDEDESQIYESLDNLDNDEDYTIRDTKEMAHHTLAANGSKTHYVRIWIDEDTPLQNEDESYNTERYFYGKVKVIAGQKIEGDPLPPLKVLSQEGEPVATTSNIAVGDRLGYGTEEFYVIGIDGTNVQLLSRYLLNVGKYSREDAPKGLQNAEIGYTRSDVNVNNSEVAYGTFAIDECEYDENWNCIEGTEVYSNWIILYGTVPFSNSNYWYKNGWISPYSDANRFVYTEQASISKYVDDYVKTLRKKGLSAINGTLLSFSSLSNLCNYQFSFYNISNDVLSYCPKYLLETAYWIGEAYGYDEIYGLGKNRSGSYINKHYNNSDVYGVRPVINITLD